MRVLIAVASRHGSTHEIGEAIAEELRAAGLESDLRDADEVADMEGYDAAILGSAVYMGSWLPEARRLVELHQAKLASMPVWLFSSGPLGADDPKPREDPQHIPELLQASGAREHHVFVGKLDPRSLGLGERLITKVVHAPQGDFRKWEEIRGWARAIAAALRTPQSASP